MHCLCHMRRVLLVVLSLSIGIRLHLLNVELLSTVEPSCPSKCLYGMILVTLYLMVWDWRVLRAEPMLSSWKICFFFLSIIFSFSSFHGLVVWGWAHRIDSVLTLSRPCTADSILIIIIIIIIIKSISLTLFN